GGCACPALAGQGPAPRRQGHLGGDRGACGDFARKDVPLRAPALPAPAASRGEASEGGRSPLPSYLVRRGLLPETLHLFGVHRHLFTLIPLPVGRRRHVAINYIDFCRGRPPGSTEAAARGIRVFLLVEAVFGPLVGAATLAALARIRRGEPATYWQSMLDG